jgi:hypothetical protein
MIDVIAIIDTTPTISAIATIAPVAIIACQPDSRVHLHFMSGALVALQQQAIVITLLFIV